MSSWTSGLFAGLLMGCIANSLLSKKPARPRRHHRIYRMRRCALHGLFPMGTDLCPTCNEPLKTLSFRRVKVFKKKKVRR